MAVRFADEAVLVALADPASQRDAARAAELLLQEREIPARLIVNRTVPRLFARMHATIDDVMDGVGLPLVGVVPDDASVTLAAAEGKQNNDRREGMHPAAALFPHSPADALGHRRKRTTIVVRFKPAVQTRSFSKKSP